MDKNVPFGPNVRLPTIEGMTSTCEEELYVLMKEIDLAFQRNHRELIGKVDRLKASDEAKRDEIERLKALLKAKKQPSKDAEERINQLLHETEKLKNENNSLKNCLQNNSVTVSEQNTQIDSLKNNLVLQKEENLSLKEEVRNLNQKLSNLQVNYDSLEANYKSLFNLITSENVGEGRSSRQQNDGRMQFDLVDAFISQEKEKYMEEENQHCNELMSKISSEIQQFRLAIGKERERKT